MCLKPENLAAGQTIQVVEGVTVTLTSGEILRLVFEAVLQTDWSCGSSGVGAAQDQTGMPEPVLRAVLTYAYITGIFGSDEILHAGREDPVVRYLCAHRKPEWTTVRDFRKRNSSALVHSVASALGRVAEHAAGIEFTDSSSFLRSEAERRILRAIQADSIALDV